MMNMRFLSVVLATVSVLSVGAVLAFVTSGLIMGAAMTMQSCGPDTVSSIIHAAMGLALLCLMVVYVLQNLTKQVALPVLLQTFSLALLLLVSADLGRWLVKVVT